MDHIADEHLDIFCLKKGFQLENKPTKKNKVLQKFLDLLSSPSTIGIIVTFLMLYLANQYYHLKNNLDPESQKNSIFTIFHFLDQKTLDIRFKLRGEEPIQHKIAVLAIDDKSLNEIGRWPWSRFTMANLIDQMMKHEASAIGFDIVFSEPEINQTAEVLQKLKSQNPQLPPALSQAFDQELAQNQPDQLFAQVIEKYADKLVLGAIYDSAPFLYYPYQEKCVQEAIRRTDNAQVTDHEEQPPIVIVEGDKYAQVQDSLRPYFEQVFNQLDQRKKIETLSTRFNNKSESDLSYQEKVQLKKSLELSRAEYCSNWLLANDPYRKYFEENWKKIFKDYPEFQSSQFEDSLFAFQYENLINPLTERGQWTVNIPQFLSATKHTSFFNAELDEDGTLRKSPVIHRSGDTFLHSLAMKTYLVAKKQQAIISIDQDPDYPRQRKVKEVKVMTDPENSEDHFLVPVDQRGYITINYAGPQRMIPHLSASDMLNDNPTVNISHRVWDPERKIYLLKDELVNKKEFIKDTIFVIGATAVGVYDLRVTPFESNFPGVETHANIIHNLLQRNFLIRDPREDKIVQYALLVGGILLSFAISHFGALAGMLITLITAAGLLVLDQFLFKAGTIVTIVFPLILTLGMYVTMTFYKYLTEERKKKYLRSTFSKYVSPAIVDEILKDPENIELGGRKQRMTVMFSDVRGFTTISEKLDPQVLSKVLNDYLTPMTNIVFANKGTLDKYMGDAIMAFFGAPIFFEDHAKHGARCALQSIEKLKLLQQEFKVRGLPEIDIGIGLNSAEMSVGNMGSDIVRSYTVMGDAVNLGSRLEGINKEYGTRIIISEFTYQDIKEDFTAREVDWVKVKGKNQPIRIFELICEGKPESQKQLQLEAFQNGFDLYHQQKWIESLEQFKKALEIEPTDPVSQLYVERCEDYKQNPPPADWDGVFTMKTK